MAQPTAVSSAERGVVVPAPAKTMKTLRIAEE
jgi:hypothetical protein